MERKIQKIDRDRNHELKNRKYYEAFKDAMRSNAQLNAIFIETSRPWLAFDFIAFEEILHEFANALVKKDPLLLDQVQQLFPKFGKKIYSRAASNY